jgi:imidazolonepropionase-like amidohydrolase
MKFQTAGAAIVFLAACAPPRMPSVTGTADQPRTILFRDVSVFDGETMLRHQDVLVRGEMVEAVVPTGAIPKESDAHEITGTGLTLLPGLVDSHAHLFSAGEKGVAPPKPAAIGHSFLFAGVTTVLVAAGFDDARALADAREAGDTIAPHMYFAGPGITAPEGHPIPLLRAMLPWPMDALAVRTIPTAASAEDARNAVRRISEQLDIKLVKIIFDDLPPGASPHLALDALQAAVDEARVVGVRPIVHATTPDDAIAAAEAGAALLVHIPQRGLLTEEHVERLRDARVPFVSTVRLISASHELAERGPGKLEQAMYGPKLLEPWLDEPAWDLPGFSEEIDARWAEARDGTRANFRALHAAGIPVFAGTDSGVHGVFPGASLHQEIRTLVDLGMSPLEALRAATSAPAEFLDETGGFGRIAPGQRADLLLVRGDPSHDIEALSEIEEVFLNGMRLHRQGGGRPLTQPVP